MEIINKMTQDELDEIQIGEVFWDDEAGIKMVKFAENQFAIVLDEKGFVIPKPKEH